MSGPSDNAPLGFGTGGAGENGHHEFVRRAWAIVLILASVAGAAWLLWAGSAILLLLFAGILLAVFLRAVSHYVSRWTRLSDNWSLAVTILLFLGFFVGSGVLLTSPVSEQLQQISVEVPKAASQLQTEVERYPWGKTLMDQLRNSTSALGPVWGQVTSFFSMTFESVLGVLLILFFGIYFAANPLLYLDGFLQLLPPRRRPRLREMAFEMGTQLQHWLVGQLVAMTIVGILTWLGLWMLGVPLPGMLGFIAGVLDFVPVVGPWAAGILAALLGLLKEPFAPLYVGALFIGIHLVESQLIIPQVQKFSSKLPPVLTILALALFTKWFGFLGLLLSTPLLVVLLVLVRRLYQEEVLHENPETK